MIGMPRHYRRKPVTWTVRRRAYPALLFRFLVLYLSSSTFRSTVKLSFHHRRFINLRVVAFCTKGYLLATSSRITINGFGSVVLPHNKNRQFARRCGKRYE
jgi:hypothetical protein